MPVVTRRDGAFAFPYIGAAAAHKLAANIAARTVRCLFIAWVCTGPVGSNLKSVAAVRMGGLQNLAGGRGISGPSTNAEKCGPHNGTHCT